MSRAHFPINSLVLMSYKTRPDEYIKNIKKFYGDEWLGRVQYSVYLISQDCGPDSKRKLRPGDKNSLIGFAANLFKIFFENMSKMVAERIARECGIHKADALDKHQIEKMILSRHDIDSIYHIIVNFSELIEENKDSEELIKTIKNLINSEAFQVLRIVCLHHLDDQGMFYRFMRSLVGLAEKQIIPGRQDWHTILLNLFKRAIYKQRPQSRDIAFTMISLARLAKANHINFSRYAEQLPGFFQTLERSLLTAEAVGDVFNALGLAARNGIMREGNLAFFSAHLFGVLTRAIMQGDDHISQHQRMLAIQDCLYGLSSMVEARLLQRDFKIDLQEFSGIFDFLKRHADPKCFSLSVLDLGRFVKAGYGIGRFSIQGVLAKTACEGGSYLQDLNNLMRGLSYLVHANACEGYILDFEVLSMFERFAAFRGPVSYDNVCHIIPGLGDIVSYGLYNGVIDLRRVEDFLWKHANPQPESEGLRRKDVCKIIYALGQMARSGKCENAVSLELINSYVSRVGIKDLDVEDIYQIVFGIGSMVEYGAFGNRPLDIPEFVPFGFTVAPYLDQLIQLEAQPGQAKELAGIIYGSGLCASNHCLGEEVINPTHIQQVLEKLRSVSNLDEYRVFEVLDGLSKMVVARNLSIGFDVRILEWLFFETEQFRDSNPEVLSYILEAVGQTCYQGLWNGQFNIGFLNTYLDYFVHCVAGKEVTPNTATKIMSGIANITTSGLCGGPVDGKLLTQIDNICRPLPPNGHPAARARSRTPPRGRHDHSEHHDHARARSRSRSPAGSDMFRHIVKLGSQGGINHDRDNHGRGRNPTCRGGY